MDTFLPRGMQNRWRMRAVSLTPNSPPHLLSDIVEGRTDEGTLFLYQHNGSCEVINPKNWLSIDFDKA